MSRRAVPITVSPDERTTLDAWARSRTVSVRVAQRAQIIQQAAAGATNQDIESILAKITKCKEALDALH